MVLSFFYSLFSSLFIRFPCVSVLCVPLCVSVFVLVHVGVLLSCFPLLFPHSSHRVHPVMSPSSSCSLAPSLVCLSSTPVSSSCISIAFHRFLFYFDSLASPCSVCPLCFVLSCHYVHSSQLCFPCVSFLVTLTCIYVFSYHSVLSLGFLVSSPGFHV